MELASVIKKINQDYCLILYQMRLDYILYLKVQHTAHDTSFNKRHNVKNLFSKLFISVINDAIIELFCKDS